MATNYTRVFDLHHRDQVLFTYEGPLQEFDAACAVIFNTEVDHRIGMTRGIGWIEATASQLSAYQRNCIACPVFSLPIGDLHL